MAFAAGARVGPYEIMRLIGAGGMGEVYQARDTRLQRVIALKTLSSEKMAGEDQKRRLLEEAQAASRLNHPHIVVIHDIFEQDGASFMAMEYVAGVTLEQVIPAGGLSLQQAMKYAGEIADALAAAHSAGIIHRDLKPANIMIAEDGRVKLLDFGLAKLSAAPAAAHLEAQTATIPGTIMGTAAYMSPEQAEGRPLDARSDIFSFGLVVYEMLSGRRAFQGDSWISVLAAILRKEPPPLYSIRAAIPPSLQQLVARCLRKDPGQRFQTMREVMEAMADPAPVATAIDEGTPSIAVLPFVNLSGDKENEYFSDGLAEEIINALSKTPELRVIARTSAFAFRGKDQDLRTIGERLRVRTILEGSVRRAGSRVRVTAQLIEIANESQLWSERYDREMVDVFAIQDDISESIASALKIRLADPRRRSWNVEAFQNHLKGLYWYQRYNPESLAKAKEAFDRALQLDPAYAPAHAGLAVFYFGIGAVGIRRMSEVAPLAKSAAQNALALDPALSEAHSVLGLVTGAVEYDWPAAASHFEAAMAVEPVPPLVRVRYALYFLTPLGRFVEAAEQYRRALENDPLSMMVHYGMAFTSYCQGRYDIAIEHAAQAVELSLDHWLVRFAMGLAQLQSGRLPEAIASLKETLRLAPSFTLAAGFLAAAYVRSGDLEGAERCARQYVSSACCSVYYAAIGNTDRMFEFLEAALAERDPYLTRMDAEPYFARYRTDPRYRELLGKMNLA